MIIQIPAAYQPEVGQIEEFKIKGEVMDVSMDQENIGGYLVTIEVSDPLMKAVPAGMPSMPHDRTLNLRAEMKG